MSTHAYVKFSVAIILPVFISCLPVATLRHSPFRYQPATMRALPQVSLSGKKIVIDPGHGNVTSGSIGVYGTKEKDVNLAVARRLQSLLEQCGATVYMTREADTSTRWPADLPGRDDLRRRLLFRDSVAPDLFVSIHHNGSEDGSRDVNIPKVFYAMNDAGASLDAARFINAEFSGLFGSGPGIISYGNYLVLRDTKIPAILGEPCYLSCPAMERVLGDTSALQLEAMAYFCGITKWMAKGVPKITGINVDPDRGTIRVEIMSDVVLDTLLTGITMDTLRLTGKTDLYGYVAALPNPLTNGIHTFSCFAGNLNGNHAVNTVRSFSVDRPAVDLAAAVDNGSVTSGSTTRLRVTALDCYGYPVKDGCEIVENGGSAARTQNGLAVFYLTVADTEQSVKVRCGSAVVNVCIPAGKGTVAPFQGFVVLPDSIRGVTPVLISAAGECYTTDVNGFFSIGAPDSVAVVCAAVNAAGFQDTVVVLTRGAVIRIRPVPRAHGSLFGKKIIIDPEFGGVESGGTNRYGIRACDVNRSISEMIAGLLRNYGCTVYLARQDDHTIHQTERVFIAEEHIADAYIIIRSDSLRNVPAVSCLPGSTQSRILAEKIAAQWKKAGGEPLTVVEEYNIVMQQTRCPAVTLSVCPLAEQKTVFSADFGKIVKNILDGLIEYYLP